MIVAASKGIDWGLVVPIVSAVTALLAAVFGFFRNRRTDTITLYSSFVDDLHEEVTRLRSQYEEDRRLWDDDKRALTSRNRELEDENVEVRSEMAVLRIQVAERGDHPGGTKPVSRTRKRAQ